MSVPAAAQPPTAVPPEAVPIPAPAIAYPPPSAAPAAPVVAAYPKAPAGSRLLALIIDGIVGSAILPVGIMLVVGAAMREEQSVPGLALIAMGGMWQLGYTLGRDAFGGAGVGKRLTGLVVLSAQTGRVAGAGAAIVRQLVLYAVQLLPVLGSLIEPVMVLVDKDGRRLGDKAARTQVVSRAVAQASGAVSPAAKGAAVGMLAAALAVNVIGCVLGGVAIARGVSGTQPTFTATPSAVTTPVREMPAEQPAEDAPAAKAAEAGTPADPLNKETAVDAVGNLLNHLKENDVQAARRYATRNFQEGKDWFFAPAGGALARFEVTAAYQDQALWVVEVDEDWNSGPQKSRYFVVVEDNTPRVDDVDHLEQ